jgi:trehalose 6-phosphate phosphatase
MMSSYLYSHTGLNALAPYVSPDTLFAFDLDGTLAPIVEDYAAAKVDGSIRTALEQLIRLAKVAVITGRSRADAKAILGIEPHLLVGNHGAEWPDNRDNKYAEYCTIWKTQLQQSLSKVQGVELEYKWFSISLHYRKAQDKENTLASIDQAIKKLNPQPKRVAGKFVVNLLPSEAFTKGEALLAAMDKLFTQRAVFVGDDVTDEDVFQLKNVDLLGIHIGQNDQTAAEFYLKKQTELLGLLKSIVSILELHAENQ